MKAKAPIEQHATRVEAGSVFASGIQPPEDVNKQYPAGVDLRLSANSEAVDAGQAIANFTAGHAGKAPDLGAYELGQPLPHYGPRK